MDPSAHVTASGRSFSMSSVRHNFRPATSPSPGQLSSSSSSRNNNVVTFYASAFQAGADFSNNTNSLLSSGATDSHREGRATNSRALLTSALEEAQTAVQLDHLGKTTAALDSYRRATAFLATAMQVSTSGEELHRLRTIVDSYQLRIHVLAAKAVEPPLISMPKSLLASYSSSAPSANISPLDQATATGGSLNFAMPSRSHVAFQGGGDSQPASTSVAPLKTKRSVSSNALVKQSLHGEALPRDGNSKKGRWPRGRSHTLGSLCSSPGDLVTSTEPLRIPRRQTEFVINGVDYSSDSGSNSSGPKKRARDLLLAKSTPLHLAPTVPLPPLPSDDACPRPSTAISRPSETLHSPPLSPKKSSRRISPLVPLTTATDREAFTLSPVFHSNLPSPVSPQLVAPPESFLETYSKEALSLTPESDDDSSPHGRQQEEVLSISNATPLCSREIFSLTPVFHNTLKAASSKPHTRGASTPLAEGTHDPLILDPACHNTHKPEPDSPPKNLSIQSKGTNSHHGIENVVREAAATTPDTWLPNFSDYFAQRSDSSPARRRRVQIKEPLSVHEKDQDSVIKELTAELEHTDRATPLARRNEPNSTVSVHFSTTFVHRKRQESLSSVSPAEPTKTSTLGGSNSLALNPDPSPRSKSAGGSIARAALFDRPLPPDPTSISSFPPGLSSPMPDLPKDRRQLRRSWTLLDVINDDPFQGMNESYQRKIPNQEPAPAEPFLRCFWLMRRLEQTMTQGGFLSKRLYVPPQVWYQRALVRLPAVETKLQGCQQLAKMLDDLMIQSKKGIITLLIPGGAGVEQDHDRLMLLKELETLELVALQIWTKLSKKLSFIQKPDKHPGSLGLSASMAGGSVSTARSDSASASSSGGRADHSRDHTLLSSFASGGAIAGSMFYPTESPKRSPLPVYDSMDDDDEGMETLGQKAVDFNCDRDIHAKVAKGPVSVKESDLGEPIERTLSLDSATPSNSTSTSTSNTGAFDLGESVTSLESSSSATQSPNRKASPPLLSIPASKTSSRKRHLVRKSLDDFIRSRDRLPYDHSLFVPIVNPKKAMASGGSSPNKGSKQDQGHSPSQTPGYGNNGSSSNLPGSDLLASQFKSLSMSIQKSILYDKLEDTSIYTETVLHLFQSSYILESMLKHYDSLVPFQIHLQLINKLRRLCDFLYFVVCPFVLQDLQELIPKYLKQVSLSE